MSTRCLCTVQRYNHTSAYINRQMYLHRKISVSVTQLHSTAKGRNNRLMPSHHTSNITGNINNPYHFHGESSYLISSLSTTLPTKLHEYLEMVSTSPWCMDRVIQHKSCLRDLSHSDVGPLFKRPKLFNLFAPVKRNFSHSCRYRFSISDASEGAGNRILARMSRPLPGGPCCAGVDCSPHTSPA